MFKNISDKIQLPFLFGIGGIGDFLLLMSDGNYDLEDELGLIFWANNPAVIKELVKLFPKITKPIITPNYISGEVRKAHQYFDEIIQERLFLSKAHIPDNLDYINEWYNCNVFKKYQLKRYPDWVITWQFGKSIEEQPYSIFAPTGGSSDTSWKHKYIKQDIFLKLLNEDTAPIKYIISTEKEIRNIYGDKFFAGNLLARTDCKFLLDQPLEKLFEVICMATRVYSVDTWVKTLSLFANVPTVLINSFYENSPFIAMGLKKDPGDCIFIENWGLEKIIDIVN